MLTKIFIRYHTKKDNFINSAIHSVLMANDSLFIQVMGDYPINRVLDFLITFKDFDYSMTDIAENSSVSWSTLNLFWKDLEKNNIVKQTRVVGRAKMYVLDVSNPVVQELIRMHLLIAKTYTQRRFAKIEVVA